jgi:hypothetical protein
MTAALGQLELGGVSDDDCAIEWQPNRTRIGYGLKPCAPQMGTGERQHPVRRELPTLAPRLEEMMIELGFRQGGNGLPA